MAKKTKTHPGNSNAPYNRRRAPGVGSITITLPDDTRKQLDALASAENRSISNWLDTHLWPMVDKMTDPNSQKQ